MKSENPRVTRTKSCLRAALIELLKEEPFENITIKAICERASVNRSTFYTYYTCPRDLIDEIENDILSKLPDYNPAGHRPFIETFQPFMQYIKDNGDSFRILLSSSVDSSFGEQIMRAVMDKYDEFAVLDDKEEMRFRFIFAVNGCVGVVREWINSGFRWSVEKVSHTIIELAFRSAGMDTSGAFEER